jgi:uncharacterized protein (TIGR02246 family)
LQSDSPKKEGSVRKLTFVLLFLSLGFFYGCQKTTPAVDVEAEKALIQSVLDNYVASIENEDMDLYAKCVAHDADMANFGAMGEPIIGWEALKNVIEGQNAALSETKISVTEMKIHVAEDGKLAWATCLWDLAAKMGENPISLPVRCTWVLEKREGAWAIVHFHKSITMK